MVCTLLFPVGDKAVVKLTIEVICGCCLTPLLGYWGAGGNLDHSARINSEYWSWEVQAVVYSQGQHCALADNGVVQVCIVWAGVMKCNRSWVVSLTCW